LVTHGEDEFDQDVFALSNNFKTEYEQLLEAYNGGHCANGFSQECDNNNNNMKLIFESTTLHNFNKGHGQNYSSSPFAIT